MHVCIVGFGVCGQALYQFCMRKNWQVFVFDDHKKGPFICNHLESVRAFDYVIISPGIRENHSLYQLATEAGNLISEMQFSLLHVRGKKIAITGTNGKSSACTLLFDALKLKNENVFLAGNIGAPLIDLSSKADDDSLIVLELSSYQLELLEAKPFEVGAILNISQDHLDSYENFSAYKNAKLRLLQRVKNVCYYDENTSLDETLIKVLQHFNVEKQEFFRAKKNFKGLAHRLEKVLVYENITCFNDSKATNPSATLYAIDQFNTKIYCIVGGQDKGLSFNCWQKVFQKRVQKVFVIGACAKKIENVLSNYCKVEYIKGFTDAFDVVFDGQKQEAVLLFSPGCSSFDAYENYKERGNCFVRSLVNYVKKRDGGSLLFDECSAHGDSFCRRD